MIARPINKPIKMHHQEMRPVKAIMSNGPIPTPIRETKSKYTMFRPAVVSIMMFANSVKPPDMIAQIRSP